MLLLIGAFTVTIAGLVMWAGQQRDERVRNCPAGAARTTQGELELCVRGRGWVPAAICPNGQPCPAVLP